MVFTVGKITDVILLKFGSVPNELWRKEFRQKDLKTQTKQTLIDNSMCVKIPMQTESQRGLVKILQLSWEFFCDLNLAAKLLSKTISLAASRPIRRKSIIPIQIKGCCLLIYSVIQLHITNLQWTCVTWLCTGGTRSEADEWNQDKGPSDKDKHVEQGATPKV